MWNEDLNKIKELTKSSKSLADILRKLGKNVNGGTCRTLKKIINKNGLSFGCKKINREEYEKSPRHCMACGKKLDFDQRHNKFCSKSCAATVNNKRFPKRKKIKINSGKRTYPEQRKYKENNLYCVVCGKKLTGNQKKFCSAKCKKDYYSPQSHDFSYAWKNDKKGTLIKYEYILKMGGKCSKCGYDKNLAALVFHHLHDKEFTLNARNLSRLPKEVIEKEIEKCVLLCHNCHNEEHYQYLNKENIEKLLNNKKDNN